MKKKLGPLPVWVWLGIVVVGGYMFYRYRSTAGAPEVEGYYPAEHREPNEGEAAAGGSGGGISGLAETLGALRDAGFVPAGSEQAERPERPEPPEKPQWWEDLISQIVGERLAPGRGAKDKTKKSRGKGKDKGQGAKAGKGKGSGPRPVRGQTIVNPAQAQNHQAPNHQHTPNHKASQHPRQRIATPAPVRTPARSGGGGGGGGGAAGGGGGNNKKKKRR